MDVYKATEIYKKEFPDTQLKRGALLAIFGMSKFTNHERMIDYLQFLYDIGIITGEEFIRIKKLSVGGE